MPPGPGSNKRPTGAVPKTKPQRKNSVPQEMVAPTRRDLQEHLNVSENKYLCNFLFVWAHKIVFVTPVCKRRQSRMYERS